MSEHNTTQCVLFPGIFHRPVVAKFDQRQGSSDGGAILLGAADRRLGLTAVLAQALEDKRQSKKIKHELSELLTQRVMAIACGYPDTNDAGGENPPQVRKRAVPSNVSPPMDNLTCGFSRLLRVALGVFQMARLILEMRSRSRNTTSNKRRLERLASQFLYVAERRSEQRSNSTTAERIGIANRTPGGVSLTM